MVISVIVYHVFYAFNSVGLIRNVDIPGISARHALQKRTHGEFLKEWVRKLPVPSLAVIFLLGCGKAWWDRETAFTRYMMGRSFGFFVRHNYLVVLFAWGIDVLIHPAAIWYYVLEFVLLVLVMPALYEMLSRISVVRGLFYGK